jgi:alpha-galactosidase
MVNVAMIGAGSVVFSKNLTGDILGFPEFRGASFRYMDVDRDRLEVGAQLCAKVAESLGATPSITATRDRREALRGADFVINMAQVGGFDATLIDFEIPRKYGLHFTIADTTGPGGLFRALRTFPMLRALCRDMEELCPRAVLLNYANPMSMNMQTITRTSTVRAVGLCHSVQGTLCQLMEYLGINPSIVAFTCAGINHMAFYLRLEDEQGNDLYPRLFEAMRRPEVYNSNKVRFEIMRRLGYFVTESSEHNAEYSPWFIPHGPDVRGKFNVPIDEYLRRCDGIIEEFGRMRADCAAGKGVAKVHRSSEYGSTIIHSMAAGTPAVVYGNMPNRGAIANLPSDAIAEAPTLVDRSGLRFATVGELPPQLIGYMHPHVTQHELFIRAAMEGRRDHIYQAAMFDPLTAATLPPDRIVELCDELIAAHGMEKDGGVLPDLDAKRTLVPTSGKIFPRADTTALRASWTAARKKCEQGVVTRWHVLGAFRAEPGRATLETNTPFERELVSLAERRGAVDLTKPVGWGDVTLEWRPACAGKRGFVDLGKLLGEVEWAMAYGYAEVESVHARDTILKCGSDDGIKVWLNGELIHAHEVGRAYLPGNDEVAARLVAGVNRLLVKVVNYSGGWGFGVSVPPANF